MLLNPMYKKRCTKSSIATLVLFFCLFVRLFVYNDIPLAIFLSEPEEEGIAQYSQMVTARSWKLNKIQLKFLVAPRRSLVLKVYVDKMICSFEFFMCSCNVVCKPKCKWKIRPKIASDTPVKTKTSA